LRGWICRRSLFRQGGDIALNVEQAAERREPLHGSSARPLIAERRVPCTKLSKHVRIELADLDAFIAAGRVEVTPR